MYIYAFIYIYIYFYFAFAACSQHCRFCLASDTCEPNGCYSGYTFDAALQTCRGIRF